MAVMNNLPNLGKFNNATQGTDGLLSRNDKEKLDSLEAARTYKFILYAANWTNARPYTQEIQIEDMTLDMNGTLAMDPIATDEEIEAAADAEIVIKTQSAGYLEIEAVDKKPQIDIPAIVVYGNNLAVINPPKIIDSSNKVVELTINPTEWKIVQDRYAVTLNVPGISSLSEGSVGPKDGISEEEAWAMAMAKIAIANVEDDTVLLECKGDKPNIAFHIIFIFGPNVNLIEVAKFGGKVTPEAKYVKFDDSKTGINSTNVQSAIENIVLGITGMNNKITHFKTIATMKEAMNLLTGQLVMTSGYYTENDGGGANYLITSNVDLPDNGGSVHVLKNNLRAELVQLRGEDLNLKVFGAYCDEFHDDSKAFNRAFDVCKMMKGGTITFQGRCAISSPLVIDSPYIHIRGFGSNSIIKSNTDMNYAIKLDYGTNVDVLRQVTLKDFNIDANHHATAGILVGNNVTATTSLFQNINVENAMGPGLTLDSTQKCEFDLIRTNNCHGSVLLLNGAADNTFTNFDFSASIEEFNIVSDKDENFAGYKLNIYNNQPTRNRFINGTIGNSQSKGLVNVVQGNDIQFINCMFDLTKTVCTDYAFVTGKNSFYTSFDNCQLNAQSKTCGLFKNDGLETTISNFKASDTKASIHVLSSNRMIITDFMLNGDSTPLIMHSSNTDEAIIEIDRPINRVINDNTLFPANANHYNFYMNNQDDLGVVGIKDHYHIAKHLDGELIDEIFTFANTDKITVKKKLPLEGVWQLDIIMYTEDANQGIISKFNVIFKQNSVYSVKNVQTLANALTWGFNLTADAPTIDELGNFTIKYNGQKNVNIGKWVVKLKAERVRSF